MSEQKEKTIDLALITACKFNPRKTFDKNGLKELEDSIRKQGVLQAILVRPMGKAFEIICGERRFRAATAAGLKEIPARVKEMDDKTALEVQVIENQQRADLHPLEEAEGYELLMKRHKETVDEIAAKVGKSKTYVYQRMTLCALVPKCRQMFYDGKLTPSTALLIARMPKDIQKKASRDITEGYGGPMNLQEARNRIRNNYMLELKDAKFSNDDSICPERGSCATCPKRTGNQELLFSDIKDGDRCTDPACFDAKNKEYGRRQLEKAKKTGGVIVKTEVAFPHEYSDSLGGGYVDLKSCCYKDDKNRTYGELLKKCPDFKPCVTVDRKGLVREIVKESDALKTMKESGIKVSDGGSGRSPANMAKAKTENRIREAKRGFWIGKVAGAQDRRCINAVVLSQVLSDMGHGQASELTKGKIKDKGYGSAWEIPALYELGDEEMQKIMIKAISKKSYGLNDEDLEFLSGKLGFNVDKDYVITETYLNAMTKEDLIALIGEFQIKYTFLETTKKKEFIDVILKNAPKGKVPAELAKPKAKAKK